MAMQVEIGPEGERDPSARGSAAIVGNLLEDGEQIALLLDVLGWPAVRYASLADLPPGRIRWLFLEQSATGVESDITSCLFQFEAESVVLFGVADNQPASDRLLGAVNHVLRTPLELSLVERILDGTADKEVIN